jgi:hypothetical protein
MAMGPNTHSIDGPEVLGSRWNVENVQNMLLQIAALRRPSIKALKRTGSCFHPSRVG